MMAMANSIEREGVYYVGLIAHRNKWMFNKLEENDIGIDAQMEFPVPVDGKRLIIGLQIKSGPSFFRERNGNYIIFREQGDKHRDYWIKYPMPCILVLHNPETKLTIWQKLTAETIERAKNGKDIFVKVPLNQIFLDNHSNKELFALGDYDYFSSGLVFTDVEIPYKG